MSIKSKRILFSALPAAVLKEKQDGLHFSAPAIKIATEHEVIVFAISDAGEGLALDVQVSKEQIGHPINILIPESDLPRGNLTVDYGVLQSEKSVFRSKVSHYKPK
ncbi:MULTISPECIES: hypothetical protein [unclassified Pseudomonas]|uniref:hypothetical protein n=1 Tax=unclassified Pseudomonas TaxID=196821 RepID=UPI000A1FC61B|nr:MULTISPECIES: hypothetical protein [unclassified Pseudomonas]